LHSHWVCDRAAHHPRIACAQHHLKGTIVKATLIKESQNARNMETQKERVNTLRVISRILGTDKGLQTVCEARFYMARRSDGASPIYCSLWVSGTQWTSGHGSASGYGYHKQSAALQSAIDSAGIRLTGDNYRELPSDATSDAMARINGCGDSPARAAMRAIAIAVGADPELMLVG
jgi:hypothetical protein